MTRQEQNEFWVRSITDALADTPGISESIGKSFANWFQQLAQMGFEQIASKQASAAPQDAGGAPDAGGQPAPQPA